MVQAFGYTEDEAPVITDEVHAKLAQAEKITDAIVEPAYAVLTEDQRRQLVDGVAALKAALKA
jgi:DNA-binding MarR family transcriptional regulator